MPTATLDVEFAAPPEIHPVLQHVLADDTAPSEALDFLIRFATDRGANDLFCGALSAGHVVEMRCDGVIQKLGIVPDNWAERFIAHTKVAAQMDPAEHRRPQDGRIVVNALDGPIDVRINTLPTFYGEDLALRILAPRYRLIDLENLGMSSRSMSIMDWVLRQPHGLVLVSGPTGSGKSTTLYAILRKLNDGTRKINTIEDPVECLLPGIHQTQVNPRIGQDFSDLLPAVLRQDPDVIMVGEVRDANTATTALRAAVTGQVVLATLHAPRAAGAVQSMLGLGANNHLLAASLRSVIAQALLRRVCDRCAEPLETKNVAVSFDDVQHLLGPDAKPSPRRGRGCAACMGSGYHGLFGIFELIRCTPGISDLIEHGATPDELEAKSIEEGMTPLRSWAKLAVARGITTLEEVNRAIVLDPGA